ncbi:MAG: hypothetical protein MZV64_73405 [Ignavibacteriales bacterium]|nr:hypothetical protein [Ignavibacteriales bacterium]
MLAVNRQYLLFDFGDFNGFLVSGDWSVALGEYLEAERGFRLLPGARCPPSTTEWINEDGSEIEQDLKLRIMPADGGGEDPAARSEAGVPALRRRPAWASTSGATAKPASSSATDDKHLPRLVRRRAARRWARSPSSACRGRVSQSAIIGVEGRYQWGEGDLSQDFLGDKIDLGGFSILATFGYRF